MKFWISFIAVFTLSSAFALPMQTFKTERWQTTNGAKVVFYQAKEVPMLEVDVAFAAGSAYDGKQYGISALTTHLLAEGNGNLTATQLAEKFANVGAQFSAESSRDMAVLQLKTLTESHALTEAIEGFSLVLSKPQFFQTSFQREKSQQLMAIAHRDESPSELANIAFFDKLYHDHPYAHPITGTAKSVSQIRNYDVRQFYKKYFVASNAVIVIVGAIDSDQAHKLAEQLISTLPTGSAAPIVPKAAPLTAKETVTIPYPSSQTLLTVGQLGIDHRGADYFPLMVGDYILGGGALVSRLSTEVREKRGLTYGVQSQLLPMPGDGPFLISLTTQSKQVGTALKVTEDTLAGFLETGPSEEELAQAKQYLIGSMPVSLSSNSQISGMLLRLAFYQLPDNYLDDYAKNIAAVSTEDIKAAFNRLIKLDKMLTVAVGASDSIIPAKI